MSVARDDVLAMVRGALADDSPIPPIPRAYNRAGAWKGADPIEVFLQRASEYGAVVHRLPRSELEAAIEKRCAQLGARRVAVPPGLDVRLDGLELVLDSPPLGYAALDSLDAALTGATLAIAEVGAIVLAGGDACGRRALTLLPDLHLCVIAEHNVLPTLPDAVAALEGAVAAGCPVTFVAGPSATSDIELERVEGVHGPRRLEVFVTSA